MNEFHKYWAFSLMVEHTPDKGEVAGSNLARPWCLFCSGVGI